MFYHKKITKITLLTLLIICLSTVAYAMPQTEIDRVTAQILPQLDRAEPVFTEIETTVYFTALIDSSTPWCSPDKGSCFTTTQQIREHYPHTARCLDERKGWCCISPHNRGVYEEVKCQGTGVYEDCSTGTCKQVVYEADSIQPTKEASPAIETTSLGGSTASGTSPQRKWTVAVNDARDTPCHIRYGTLLYIDFGQGNLWNGLYRAEDRGSAFVGQCKMDIYVGVGAEAASQAIREGISSAKPKIYVLEPTDSDSIPPLLSSTRLAESYRFISRQEYASKFGSQTIPSEYIPQIDRDINQAGELFLPYSFRTTLKGIAGFYENIREFSNKVLEECSSLPYEQRAACAHNIAEQYEEKGTEINNCMQSTTPKNADDLEINKITNLAGIIKNMNKGQNNITIELQQIQGETLNFTLIIPNIYHHSFRDEEGVYVELFDITINKTNPLTVRFSEQQSTLRVQPPSQRWVTEKNMKLLALKAADCQSYPVNCICEINLISSDKEIILEDNTISAEGEEDIISFMSFHRQDTNIQHAIVPLTNPETQTGFPLPNQQDTYATIPSDTFLASFKKETATSMMTYIKQNNEPILQTCEPTKRHVIFCAKPITEGKPYFERTFYPKMNFALKI